MMIGVDFMPSNQISNMSLNGLRRRVANHNKTKTRTHMDEPSIVLCLGHMFHLVGPLYCQSISYKRVCYRISGIRVLLNEA
jgi:hypothetical protein